MTPNPIREAVDKKSRHRIGMMRTPVGEQENREIADYRAKKNLVLDMSGTYKGTFGT